METWLVERSYMKSSTCAWYFRGENTISFNCGMLLQTWKIAGEGKQMSFFFNGGELADKFLLLSAAMELI